MICVVGSGPAGVSAAYALVKAGHEVLMLDAGVTLEPEVQKTVSRMAGSDKGAWQAADLARVRDRMQATADGVPLKYVYGSDFPYRGAETGIGLERRQAALLPSFALGGLANVWGGAILPNCADDMADWPLSLDDLAPHYRAIHDFMPLSGARDDLEALFPLYGEPYAVPVSQQAGQLLADLRRRPVPGLRFGQSRLALSTGCVACGLCLYGCPYGLIYSSAETVALLRTLPNFSYQPATVVRRVREARGEVIIEAEQGGEAVTIAAEALFLAAGVLPSTRIILESLGAFDHPVPVRSSQYFLFPLLRPQRTAGAGTEELHTLAQLFLELSDPQLSPFTIHLQCYTYNDLFRGALHNALGPLARALPLDLLLERLLLVQGYLHSDLSPPLRLTLRRDGLELVGEPTPGADAIVRGVMRKLRGIGLPFSPRVGLPGQGFHAGGTLPMRRSPAPFETDLRGRPRGFERVHVVDASVLPSIPATTITYTAMANAHRIAAEYARPPRPPRKARRCAITGANGYVGSALATFLRQQGFEVIPLVRGPVGGEREYALDGPVGPDLLEGIDCLVHAAHDFSATGAEEMQRINLEGSRRLFAAARDAGVRRVVFVSSLSAFEGCRSEYGRTKLAIEGIARSCGAAVVRPGLVFGPRPGGMTGALKRLAGRRVIPLAGRGDQLLYLAHQEDLGRLVLHLLTTPDAVAGEPVAAAHPRPLTMREIIAGLAASRRFFLPLPGRMLLLALRLLEAFGHASRLRSDSLVSLLTPTPPPDFSLLETTGVVFRPFSDRKPQPQKRQLTTDAHR
jgi:nucleoside-diphosphate-sugar epimerase/choline dehydrogenase-like flavoprotein